MPRPLEDMQSHFADAEREGVLEQIAAAVATAGSKNAIPFPVYCAGPGCPVVTVRTAEEFDAARPKRMRVAKSKTRAR